MRRNCLSPKKKGEGGQIESSWSPGSLQVPAHTARFCILLGIRLPTASGTYFKTLAEKVLWDSCHGGQQLKFSFETGGKPDRNGVEFDKLEKRRGCPWQLLRAPRDVFTSGVRLAQKGGPGQPTGFPRLLPSLSASPCLLPKLSEATGNPWQPRPRAVLTAARLWWEGHLGPPPLLLVPVWARASWQVTADPIQSFCPGLLSQVPPSAFHTHTHIHSLITRRKLMLC